MSHRKENGQQSFGSDAFEAVWTADGHIAEETLYAWLDDALSAADATRIVAHLEECGHCKPMVAEARGIMAATSQIVGALDAVPRGIVPREDVACTASRIVAMAKATAGETQRPVLRPWYMRRVVQMAAGVAVLVGGTTWIAKRAEKPLTVHESVTKADAGSFQRAAEGPVKDSMAPLEKREVAARPDTITTVSKVVASKAVASTSRLRDIASADKRKSVAKERADKPLATPMPPVSIVATTPPLVERSSVAFSVSTITPGTVAGIVTDAETGKPVEGVQVTVQGTTIGNLTNAAGRFSLTGVPEGVRQVQARRLGYQSVIVSLDSAVRETAQLSLQLRATNQTLAAVEVQAPTTPLIQRIAPMTIGATRCLRPRLNADSAGGPLFGMLRGNIAGTGSQQLSIVGWPASNENTPGSFVLNADGTLRGTAVSGELRLVFELRANTGASNSVWSGTVEEQRRGVSRVKNTIMDADSSAAACDLPPATR